MFPFLTTLCTQTKNALDEIMVDDIKNKSNANAARAPQGKRKMVDGFIRWCKRGDVGLSQSITVEDVLDEFPTGLYDEFYVQTGR